MSQGAFVVSVSQNGINSTPVGSVPCSRMNTGVHDELLRFRSRSDQMVRLKRSQFENQKRGLERQVRRKNTGFEFQADGSVNGVV